MNNPNRPTKERPDSNQRPEKNRVQRSGGNPSQQRPQNANVRQVNPTRTPRPNTGAPVNGQRAGAQSRPNGNAQQQRANPNGAYQRNNGYSQPRRQPTPEEIAFKREQAAQAARKAAYIKKQKQIRRQNVIKRICIILGIIAVLSLILLGLFFYYYKIYDKDPAKEKEVGKTTFIFGGKTVREVNTDDCVANGLAFVCFNDISDYLGMVESGSADGLKFIIKTVDKETGEPVVIDSSGTGYEEYIIFKTDSREVIINGENVRSDGYSYLIGEEVWVSSTFIAENMNNLSVVYSPAKHTVTVARIADEENSTENEIVYLPVSFKIKSTVNVPKVEEPDESQTTEVIIPDTTPSDEVLFGVEPDDTTNEVDTENENPSLENTDEKTENTDTLEVKEEEPAVEADKKDEETDKNESEKDNNKKDFMMSDDGYTTIEVSASGQETVTYNDGTQNYSFTFQNDLTDYEQYFSPSDRDNYLILVNTKSTIGEDFVPSDLVASPYTASGRSTIYLRKNAEMALEGMIKEMESAGLYGMQVNSGYRDYTYQKGLFATYTEREMSNNPSLTKEQAETIVLTYSTRPGTSEHQTGLAIDMENGASFSTDWKYSSHFKWLYENAWKFGFVLRFPEDKTDITTIQFEPWHWRYVGRYHAKQIHDKDICLEEYLAMGN